MNDIKNNADQSQVLEQQLYAYFSLYKVEPAYKSTLRKQLIIRSTQQSLKEIVESKRKLAADWLYRPGIKWAAGILFFITVLSSLIAIHLVRASIERALDIGYVDKAGFVKVSETNILNGPTYSLKPDQTIGIDQVVADPKKIQIWFHSTSKIYSPEGTNGEFIAYLDVNGQELPLISWGWNYYNQNGMIEFRSLGTTAPLSFTLHISPDWVIPIRLIPMSQMAKNQAMTIFPDVCQNNVGINLCLRAFVSDLTGYHLWLSASSEKPKFYLETLDTSNHLIGEQAILMDASGHQLTQIYPTEVLTPYVLPPVRSALFPQEVTTTLSFDRSSSDNGPLTLLVSGLTVKTSVNELIMCEPGKNPGIGDQFPCEKSMNIAGELIKFHTGEITQNRHGIVLTLRSDPIQSSNGLLLTGVDLENINDYSESTIGTGFDVRTKQLELWFTVDPANTETLYGIRIIGADLTILEPFQLSWTLNP